MCQWHGHPSFELTNKGKLAAKCGKVGCDYVDPVLGPNDFNDEADKHAKPAPRGALKLPPPIQPPSYVPPSQAPGPVDVIAMIRARKEFIELEIARLDGLKAEHKKLTRMLNAAAKETHVPVS